MRSLRSSEVCLAALVLLAGCGASTGGASRDAAADAGPDATLADAGHDATLADGAPPDAGAPSDAGADVARPVDGMSPAPDAGGSSLFAVVQAIFTAQCTSCHDAKLVPTPVPDRAPVYPMLPLTAGASYAALVGKPAIDACAGTLVKPRDPNASYLYLVVSQDNPCTGRRMPRGGGNIRPPDPLPAAQIEAIRAWIAAGAPP